jgi:S-(hydroxymethyl)glutathione dehydrogenase / alcohol dehydrogenase
MAMRAAVLHQYNVMPELEEVTVAEPQEGEVVVRLAASGICGSDVHLSHGMPDFGDVLPMILGHEGAGVIETVGPGVTDLKRGDRVIIAMGSPCGRCEYCGEGRMQFCNSLCSPLYKNIRGTYDGTSHAAIARIL